MYFSRQAFSIELTQEIFPEILEVIQLFLEDQEKGFDNYLGFIQKIKNPLQKIIQSYRHPGTIGLLSPRLLREPRFLDGKEAELTTQEKKSHVLGYLKAFILLLSAGSFNLEPWNFKNTAIFNRLSRITSISDLYRILPSIMEEISQIQIEEIQLENQTPAPEISLKWLEEEEKGVSRNKDKTVPFTARMTAFHRFLESQSKKPLLTDPFAEKLAGDLTAYARKHSFSSQRSDYTIVRSYFIEESLLKPWCQMIPEGQIVLLGAGLDTRAYRFEPLTMGTFTIIEIDLPAIIKYKEAILKDSLPLCNLRRLSIDLNTPEWTGELLKSGISSTLPIFWILEGVAYYLEKDVILNLLNHTALLSSLKSEIFLDVCVPAMADLKFGPFTRYFTWGIEYDHVPELFEKSTWGIKWLYADTVAQRRDVGQRGMIFIHGQKQTQDIIQEI